MSWSCTSGEALNRHDGGAKVLSAVKNGTLSLLRDALRAGCSPDATDQGGRSALQYAAILGRSECVEILLGAGAEIDWATNNNQSTALHMACTYGFCDVSEQLCSAGAYLENEDNDGLTPLLCSIKYARSEWERCVDVLIDHRCNPFARASSGETALHFAAQSGSSRLMDRLVSMGLTWEDKTCKGESVLSFALKGNHEECVLYLIDKGVSVEHDSALMGCTLMDIAQARGWYSVIARLQRDALLQSYMGAILPLEMAAGLSL